jgi:hypothetical protein
MAAVLQGRSSLTIQGVEEKEGGEYVCQVSTITHLIATSFYLDIQGRSKGFLEEEKTRIVSKYSEGEQRRKQLMRARNESKKR